MWLNWIPRKLLTDADQLAFTNFHSLFRRILSCTISICLLTSFNFRFNFATCSGVRVESRLPLWPGISIFTNRKYKWRINRWVDRIVLHLLHNFWFEIMRFRWLLEQKQNLVAKITIHNFFTDLLNMIVCWQWSLWLLTKYYDEVFLAIVFYTLHV